MAAITALALLNGAATPVSKTFSPMDANSELATWIDRSGGIATGTPAVTLSVKIADAKNASSVTRIKAKMSYPVMEVISNNTIAGYTPQPQIAFAGYANVEFVMPGRMTLLQRQDLLAFTKDLLTKAVISDAVANFERPW